MYMYQTLVLTTLLWIDSDQDVVYFLDHDMWSVDYLRDFQTVDIAKEGDSEKKMLLVEYGLRCGNEAANAKIRYTTG